MDYDSVKFIVINTTFLSEKAAIDLASKLINSRLAACCQISKIKSLYSWEGNLENEEEWQLSIKTLKVQFQKIACIIKANHQYQTPQIVALPIIDICEDYSSWIEQSIITNQ